MKLDPDFERFIEEYYSDYETAIDVVKKLLTEEYNREKLLDELVGAHLKQVKTEERKTNNET